MTQQATGELEAATRAFYAELDANDHEVFQQRFAPDAEFAFNDVDPVTGVDEIAGFVEGWKGNFQAVEHELNNIIVDPSSTTAGVEITVRYVFPNGEEVIVKGCAFLGFSGGRIVGWRVYVDTSRLS